MGLFEDFSRFLETRLDEFVQANPQLELYILDEQVREQEAGTLQLITSLKQQEQQLEQKILETAQEIKRWHERIAKAKAAQRFDLVEPAEAREAALLRQGNQIWGQMAGVKERLQQTQELYQRIQVRRQEIKTKMAAAERAPRSASSADPDTSWSRGWSATQPSYSSRAADPLEQKFRELETDDELENLKRQMGQ